MCIPTAVAVVAVAFLTAFSGPAFASDFIWTGGTGSWLTANLWSPSGIPDGSDCHVFIDGGKTQTSSSVTLTGTSRSVGTLAVDAGDYLAIGSSAYLAVSGGQISNNGTIDVIATGTSSGYLRIVGPTVIDGAGSLRLRNDTSNNRATISGLDPGDILTNGANHTICGYGDLGYDGGALGLVNEGLIDANVSGRVLSVLPNAAGAVNQGVMQASNGGQLKLTTGVFDNTDHLIQALDGSIVEIAWGATLKNGTLSCSGTGLMRVSNNNIVKFTGTIANNGAIEIKGTTSTAGVQIVGPTTLEGTGAVRLRDDASYNYVGIYGQNPEDILTNGAQHTISGYGDLGHDGATLGLVNEGLIDANVSGRILYVLPSAAGVTNHGVMQASNGGKLQLTTGVFDNTDHLIQALDGSNVEIVWGATLKGGTLSCSGTGLMRVPSNNTVKFMGTIANNGIVEITSSTSIYSAIVQIVGPTTLEGAGTVRLRDNSANTYVGIRGQNPEDILTNGPNHTISGYGSLGYDGNALGLVNEGLIDANGGGVLSVLPNAAGAINQGTMQASNGGKLQLTTGVFDNTDHLIQALNGSSVEIVWGATLKNGTLSCSGTGLIRVPDNNNVKFMGTITNNGTVEITSTTSTAVVQIVGPTKFDGAGTVRLRDGAANNYVGIRGQNPEDILTNGANHTISGYGDLGYDNNLLGLVNEGLLDANVSGRTLSLRSNAAGVINRGVAQASNGGSLALWAGTFDNQGVVAALNRSNVLFTSYGTVSNVSAAGELTAGTWQASDGGNGASISIVAAPKAISTIGPGAAVSLSGPSSAFTIKGSSIDSTLTANQGSLSLLDGRTMYTSGSLSNAGVVTLGTAAGLNIKGNYAQFAAGVTEGIGTLIASGIFTDQGTTCPGLSLGILTIDSDYVQTDSGMLQFEIFGSGTPGVDFDRLDVLGSVELSGTIEVLFDGFSPAPGDSWTLLTSSGSLTADSPTIHVLGLPGGVELAHTFDAHSYRLTVVPEPGALHLLVAGAVAAIAFYCRRRRAR
jgi:hypothetical protein